MKVPPRLGTTMSDPSVVNRICDELGVSRDEAFYYLEGFDWHLASAMEACRSKTLPKFSVNDQSTAAINSPQGSFTPPRMVDLDFSSNQNPPAPPRKTILSRPVSNQVPMAKELPPALKKEIIDGFREVAFGMSLEEVVKFLDRFNWDVTRAVNHFLDQQHPQKKDDSPMFYQSHLLPDNYNPMKGIQDLIEFSKGHTSMALPLPSLSSQSQFHSSAGIGSSSSSGSMDVDMAEMGDLHNVPSSQVQIEESSSPAQIRKDLPPPYKVDRICNEGGVAQESSSPAQIRKDPPPPYKVDRICSESGVTHESSSPAQIRKDLPPPYKVDRICSESGVTHESSSPAQIRKDLPPPYKVDIICNETGVSRDEALYYLEGFDWDLASALEACRCKTLPPDKNRSLPGFSLNEIFQVPELESTQSKPVVINSRRISKSSWSPAEELLQKKKEISSESKAGYIKDFCNVAGVSPKVAAAYLDSNNWCLSNAINCFMDEGFGYSNLQHISDDDPSTMGKSDSQWSSEADCATSGFLENLVSKVLVDMGKNICQPVPLMGLPSQSQFQASGSSSFSSMDIDLKETEESVKEGSDESVAVAISSMVSSQVDGTETSPDPEAIEDRPSEGYEEITIILADGGSGIPVTIPFKRDQTVRDIRNAIYERTKVKDSKYELQSMAEVDCRDMNVTVKRILKSGSSILLQVFPNH